MFSFFVYLSENETPNPSYWTTMIRKRVSWFRVWRSPPTHAFQKGFVLFRNKRTCCEYELCQTGLLRTWSVRTGRTVECQTWHQFNSLRSSFGPEFNSNVDALEVVGNSSRNKRTRQHYYGSFAGVVVTSKHKTSFRYTFFQNKRRMMYLNFGKTNKKLGNFFE